METLPEIVEKVVDMEQVHADAEKIELLDYFVEHPCNCMILSYLLMIGIVIASQMYGYQKFNDATPRDLINWNEPTGVDYDLLTVANEYMAVVLESQPVEEVRTHPITKMHILYQNITNNTNGLIDKKILLKI